MDPDFCGTIYIARYIRPLCPKIYPTGCCREKIKWQDILHPGARGAFAIRVSLSWAHTVHDPTHDGRTQVKIPDTVPKSHTVQNFVLKILI